jgi:hypothetical protein
MTRVRAVLVVAAVVAVLAELGTAPVAPARADAGSPKLYYTTNFPAELKVAPYSVNGDRLRVGSISVVAKLPAADGLAMAPDGDLLVGGGKTGMVFKVNPASGAFKAVPSGSPVAFHVSVSPDGTTAWTAGLPGPASRIPLNPFGPGKPAVLKGDDPNVTTIGFTPNGAFYTASTSFGSGTFGTLDVATLTTKQYRSDLRGAHGFSYDAFTKNLLLFGSFAILQVDPTNPSQIISERDISRMAFDQGVADGHGHLLAASNTGDVVFIDYSSTGLVGDRHDLLSRAFLDTNLDDLLPVNPPAVASAASSTSSSKNKKVVILLVVVIVIIGGVVAVRARGAGARRGRQR